MGDLLNREAHVLAHDPLDLASHLHNRLFLEHGGDETVATVMAKARRAMASRPWLRLSRCPPPDHESGSARRILDHGSPIHALVWSPDGTMVASGGEDGLLRLWDAVSGRPGTTLQAGAGIFGLAWSPDGTLLATAGMDVRLRSTGTMAGYRRSYRVDDVRVWDLSSGACRASLPTESTGVPLMIWSPDSAVLAFAEYARGCVTFRFWRRDEGRVTDAEPMEVEALDGLIWPTGPSPTFLCGIREEAKYRSAKRTMWLWDGVAKKGRTVRNSHLDDLYSLSWAGDHCVLASGSKDGTVYVLPGAKGRAWNAHRGASGAIRALSWSPDGQLLASAGEDRVARLWDVGPGVCVAEFSGHADHVTRLAWSPDGKALASGGVDGRVFIWPASIRAVEASTPASPEVIAAGWNSQDTLLATGHASGGVVLWDPVTGVRIGPCRERVSPMAKEIQGVLRGHTGHVRVLAFSPDGDLVATGGNDGHVALWDCRAGEVAAVLRGHKDFIYSLAWSPDGKLLASGSGEGAVRLWDRAASGVVDKAVAEIGICKRGESLWVLGLAWSPDGKILALVDAYRSIWLIDRADPNRASRVARCGGKKIGSLAWSPDGSRMACGGGDPLEQEPDADFAIRIVDIGAAREEGVLEGHGRRVTSLAWLPDGDHLVSGSTDHTVRLWNVPTGGCLATAYGLSPVLGVQIAGREGTLRIIDNGIATRNRPLACVFEPEGLRRS